MEENRSIEERLSAGREDYRNIPVPKEMRAKLEAGIARAQREREDTGKSEYSDRADHGEKENNIVSIGGKTDGKQARKGRKTGGTKMDKKRKFRIAAAVAAAAITLVILPNTGAGVAHAMGALPVVGKLFQAVTFRDYRYESERFDANVEVPKIVVEDVTGEGTEAGTMPKKDAETSDPLEETLEQINFDIEKVTNQLIEEFQASADLGESYGSLEIHHETVTNNDRYFTLKLSLYQGAGSGYESYKFYTVDKRNGKQVQIGDLFQEGSNYNEVLSENIKDQMRTQMAEDENKIYWVDYEDVPEWNWSGLKEDQNFYFDENGNIVIAFDEYEVAPGYMGASEFTVEREVFADLLK